MQNRFAACLTYCALGICQLPAAGPTSQPLPNDNSSVAQTAAPPNAAPGSDCEMDTLIQLGCQEAFKPTGYSLNFMFSDSVTLNASISPWNSLGCLKGLVNLTLTLSASLPDAWAEQGAFPALERLVVGASQVSGTLPASWGKAGAFSSLQSLSITKLPNFKGTLPESWGDPGASPSLTQLDLQEVNLSRAVPEQWGSPSAFPKLGVLSMLNCSFSGPSPLRCKCTSNSPHGM